MAEKQTDNIGVAVAFAKDFEPFVHAQITGTPNEPFSRLLYERFGAVRSIPTVLAVESETGVANPHEHAWCLVDDTSTLGQVCDLVGDRTVVIDTLGRGGGGEPGFWLIDVILSGVAWEALRRGDELAVRKLELYVYRKHRSEASKWVSTKRISPTLTRLIKSEAYWDLPGFSRVFDLDDQRSRDLLETSGYVSSRYEAGLWIEPDSEHEF